MRRCKRYQRGQMVVVMTFAMATLLGAMALCTDVAVLYYNWVQLQKGADAAALAGAGQYRRRRRANGQRARPQRRTRHAITLSRTASRNPRSEVSTLPRKISRRIRTFRQAVRPSRC